MSERPRYARVSALFLRCLGAVYVCAFVSLAVQVRVLIGRDGLQPAAAFLDAVAQQRGPIERLHEIPTLFWLASGDGVLVGAAWAGAALAAAMTLGVSGRALRFALWAIYLSFVSVGAPFLSFQWDNLLLETGLLAMFLPTRGREPSRWAVLLVRWLLFRLLLESGIAKLAFGDPTWRDGTAMASYFETAPLPTWAGWWAHQCPPAVMRFFTWFTLFAELVMPFAVFAPRRIRAASLAVLVPFQASIFLTGNYGFFNPLSTALLVFLLDDRMVERIAWRRRAPTAPAAPSSEPAAPRGVVVARAAIALALVAFSISDFALVLSRREPNAVLLRLLSIYGPYRSVNSYHLFAQMTRVRDEVVIEGTDDGSTWLPYEMRWKPGDVQRAPAFVAPHQPRVDFQMWFLPLGPRRGRNGWFDALIVRICERPELARALFAADPFEGRRPTALRVSLYRYRMTDLATRRATGAWWSRELRGIHPRLYRCGQREPPQFF